MAQDSWVALAGVLIGSVTTIVSSWVTSVSKGRSDEKARWEERQFRIQDQDREAQKAIEEKITTEDKYSFDKNQKFTVIQSKIFRARGRDELTRADQELETFLEETPEYLVGDNMTLFYLYCNSEFREQHPTLKTGDLQQQEFVRLLREFKIPSGADIRKRRNGTPI